MVKLSLILLLLVAFLISGCSSASVSPAAKIVGGVVTNVASALFKWLWSLKSTTKTEISSRSMMKFEGGYTVETVFDGSKLGIEPYYVQVSPSGNLMILDSQNSNIYSISTPFSRYSRPKLIAGSPEGYSGHIDGKSREARMNHPKGFTMDDRGNIYVADTMNMAIRKISDYGVVTIAGGKWSRGGGGGHIDGPSEDAKFSDDFDVVYVGSSCSLLIVDRGNQAIREIQLRDDDCPEKYEDSEQLVSGMAVLFAAAFFGYMLALLQMRIVAMFSSDSVAKVNAEGVPAGTYNRQQKYIQPPLIPTEDEYEKSGEGLFDSMGRLFLNTGSAIVEILGGLFTGSRRKPIHRPNQHHFRDTSRHSSNPWPTAMQESFMIPDEDEPPPPSLESSRDHPTPRKPYPVMTNEMDNLRNYKQNRTFYGGRDVDFPQQQHHHHQVQHFKKQPHPLQQQQQHYQKHQQSDAQTYYEQDCEKKEIVFGAVQEECGRREAMVIKAVHHEDPIYTNYNIRSRYNYTGYSYGY